MPIAPTIVLHELCPSIIDFAFVAIGDGVGGF